MFRIAAILAATAAFTATADLAAARDGCGSGWYWNGNQCVPSRAEQRLRNEGRFGDEQRLRDERRSTRWREGDRDFRDRDFDRSSSSRDRDFDRSTSGFSSDRRRDGCRDGYRRIDGRCTWIGRDRL